MNKARNRLLVFTAIALICALVSIAYAATSGGTIATTVTSSSSIKITVSTAASTVDSLMICYFKGASTDTTFVAYLDTTATDTTLVDLDPDTQYIVFLKAIGTTSKISDKDTVTTYPIALGDASRNGFLTRKVATARSWPMTASTMDYTFDLNGIAALDSSLVYYAKTYNGLDVYATQAADSCVAGIYFIPINWSGTYTDYTSFQQAATVADSIAISSAGLFRETLQLPVGRYYMIRILTHTGNGKDADYTLTFTSDGHN